MLFAALSDAHLCALAPALQAEFDGDGRAAAANAVLREELADRKMRDRAFYPLSPLVRPGSASPAALPASTVSDLLRRLRAHDPLGLQAAVFAIGDTTDPARGRAAADALTAQAAALTTPDDPPVLPLLLAICPLARSVLPRLSAYLRAGGAEDGAAIRLAYRDAAAVHEDAPPLLLDLLGAHLEHPWQTLRLVGAVMGRPTDGFLAASELGRFGAAVLDEVDRRIHVVRAFDPAQGPAAGEQAAAAASQAVLALAELDRCVDIALAGPWAKRITAQRRTLARGVEGRLRQADAALARALPTQGGGLGARRPKLDAPFDAEAGRRALALIALATGVRHAADYGGFAVARGKAVEALDRRLAAYADDLVEVLHEAPDEGAVQEARARTTFVAEALGRLRDARAADVMRRRAAAA